MVRQDQHLSYQKAIEDEVSVYPPGFIGGVSFGGIRMCQRQSLHLRRRCQGPHSWLYHKFSRNSSRWQSCSSGSSRERHLCNRYQDVLSVASLGEGLPRPGMRLSFTPIRRGMLMCWFSMTTILRSWKASKSSKRNSTTLSCRTKFLHQHMAATQFRLPGRRTLRPSSVWIHLSG